MTYLFNNNQQVYNTGTQLVKYVGDTNTQLDSVGRLRVSPPNQQYWYTPTVDKDGDLRYIESFTGTNSTSTFIQNISAILFSSGTSSIGKTIRISRRRHKMRPGVSTQWVATGGWNGAETNVVKRRGLFTSYNGVFFEVSNGDLSFVVRRRLIDGTLVEDQFPRSTWSYDRLDGTGPSAINLVSGSTTTVSLGSYVSKTTATVSTTEVHYNVLYNTSGIPALGAGQRGAVTGFTGSNTGFNSTVMVAATSTNTITLTYTNDPGTYSVGNGTGTLTHNGFYHLYSWWIDFDGDRNSRIRFGVYGTDGPNTCHSINYTGQLGTQWANAPAVPDRIEIYNTGTVSILPTMTWSSTAINVEAEAELNPGFGLARTTSTTVFSSAGTDEYAILGIGIRPGEPYQRGDLQLQGINIIDTANQGKNTNPASFLWRLLLNPTILTNNVTPTDIGKMSRQWDYTASTTWAGGIELLGLMGSGSSFDLRTALNFLNLGSNIEYTDADKVVLIIKQLEGGNSDANIWVTFNFIESL